MTNCRKLAALFILLVFIVTPGAQALGCMRTICSNDARNFHNQIRPCTSDGHCGEYKSKRRNNKYLEAVELSCNEGIYVYAPFDGEISYHRPFGGASKAHCADQGVRIDGSGQWRGYYVIISTVKLYRYGGRVKAGEKLGVVGNIACFEDRSAPTPVLIAAFSSKGRAIKNYVRVELFREGRPIDPTHHLVDCMCTGQICETNRINALMGSPFKHDGRYNGVRGWEISCPMVNDLNEDDDDAAAALWDDDDSEVHKSRAPKIYSPIEGSVIGRVRLDFTGGTYAGCFNEGLFIVGTGQWTDYEVRLYNVRFLEELGVGVKHIDQGQHIGTRLNCADKPAPDSVFFEVRFQGTLVDISESISAKNCQHRRFNTLFRRRRR